MTGFDRRRFLLAAATATTVGSVSGSSPVPAARGGWERSQDGVAASSYADAVRTGDDYLLVGSSRDDDATEGIAVRVDDGGGVRWERRFRSEPQRGARTEEYVGPIPEDHLSFTLETGDGDFLLVGWTYFDSAAVDVGRLYRVDADGDVEREQSLGDLEDASAYSYLTDGVAIDDGFLLCGIESPGIMLGGGGWLVAVDEDGTVDWHERYPATDRDLAETTRRDVFNAIAGTEGGYVAAGSYEPSDDGRPRAWVVGLSDDGNVRWDDRFDLEGGPATAVYDVARSDVAGYDLLVVGAVGERVPSRRQRVLDSPAVEGHGFVAAYTDDGDRQWLETVEETPLFCTERGPQGIVAGGARDGYGWVGTVDRTDFEATRESVVTTLCPGDDDGTLVAAGRRVDGGRARAWARTIDVADGSRDEDRTDENDGDDQPDDGEDERRDGDNTDDRDDEGADDETSDDGDGGEPDDDPAARSIEFVDCETVRVTGEFGDVLLSLHWWDEEGLIGTISEPVGPVDGERTIVASEEFGGEFAYGPVLAAVEGFDEGTPVVPGNGDVSVANPNVDACDEAALADFDGSGDPAADDRPAPSTDDGTDNSSADGTGGDDEPNDTNSDTAENASSEG